MLSNYTASAEDHIFDLVEAEKSDIWADIELLGSESDSEKWAAKFKSIAKEYLMSSRFALIRILSVWAKNDTRKTVVQDLVTCSNISMEYAQTLSPEKHQAYIQYLLDIAGPSPEDDPDLHERIISRAWHDLESASSLMKEEAMHDPRQLKKQYSTAFTREEALQLGHILHFTLEEMQWYLMRVFDLQDASLRMNRSSDLIETYGFLTDASCHHVELLKEEYNNKAATIKKQIDDDRSQNWTKATGSGLLERVDSWKLYPDTMDENFLSWLINRAPRLDIPSQTALRIYRNLAAYAYDGDIPPEDALLDELCDICDMNENSDKAKATLYHDGCISEQKCTQVAENLYSDNKYESKSSEKDCTKAWSVITTRKDRKLSTSYGALNSSRTRIQKLLMGEEEVEKGDLLYLLWYAFSLTWNDTKKQDSDSLCNRIFDLKDAADSFLAAALLPAFYPPHLLEQSMLFSVIYAGKEGTNPFIVYGSILDSLKESRNRESGSCKHTLQDQIEIVSEYRKNEAMTLKQCAQLYGISEQTLSRWQKELLQKNLVK